MISVFYFVFKIDSKYFLDSNNTFLEQNFRNFRQMNQFIIKFMYFRIRQNNQKCILTIHQIMVDKIVTTLLIEDNYFGLAVKGQNSRRPKNLKFSIF